MATFCQPCCGCPWRTSSKGPSLSVDAVTVIMASAMAISGGESKQQLRHLAQKHIFYISAMDRRSSLSTQPPFHRALYKKPALLFSSLSTFDLVDTRRAAKCSRKPFSCRDLTESGSISGPKETRQQSDLSRRRARGADDRLAISHTHRQRAELRGRQRRVCNLTSCRD